MYYPLIRGRQYELIALRELSQRNLISDKVVPIIEPTKFSSTLAKTIEQFKRDNKELIVIINPQIGLFSVEIKTNNEYLEKIFIANNIKSAHYIIKNSQNLLETSPMNNCNLSYAIAIDRDAINLYSDFYSSLDIKVLIPDESSFRRAVRQNRILLADRFTKCSRNADYSNCEDELFSDDHLFYQTDGFIGFADYSIVGKEYFEQGFAPYAVAIHIVYFSDNEVLRVRHFVSDSNDDIQDPAGKFGEALGKLIEWVNRQGDQRLDTFAMMEFRQHHENGTYPGLGTVKKLSIMHHLELMSNYLMQS